MSLRFTKGALNEDLFSFIELSNLIIIIAPLIDPEFSPFDIQVFSTHIIDYYLELRGKDPLIDLIDLQKIRSLINQATILVEKQYEKEIAKYDKDLIKKGTPE